MRVRRGSIWVPCPTLAWACVQRAQSMPTQAWDMAPEATSGMYTAKTSPDRLIPKRGSAAALLPTDSKLPRILRFLRLLHDVDVVVGGVEALPIDNRP